MPTKVGIVGVTGNIGKSLKMLIAEYKTLICTGGISSNNATNSDFSKLFIESDVVIDFSSNSLIEILLEHATTLKKPLVIGTTGYSKNQMEMIMDASKITPIFYSSNFSIGMHVVKKLLKILCIDLSDQYSINLIEWHQLNKKDLPSGTALSILKEILEHTNQKIDTTSIRAGKSFCEHTLCFTNDSERVSLKHEVYDRRTFAKSSLDAALFILSQEIGYYEMNDLIGSLACSK